MQQLWNIPPLLTTALTALPACLGIIRDKSKLHKRHWAKYGYGAAGL
jgi:hypothetical protein